MEEKAEASEPPPPMERRVLTEGLMLLRVEEKEAIRPPSSDSGKTAKELFIWANA